MLRRWSVFGGALAVGLLVWAVAASVWSTPAMADATFTCSTAGTACTWTAPTGVTNVSVTISGAGGGNGGTCTKAGGAGDGGEELTSVPVTVTPGDNYTLFPGVKGGSVSNNTTSGGSGGAGGTGSGAAGGTGAAGCGGGGGGGDSSVKLGITVILSAYGGGGGGGGASSSVGGVGGPSSGGSGTTNGTSGGTASSGGGGGGGGGGFGAGGTGGTAVNGGNGGNGGNDGLGGGSSYPGSGPDLNSGNGTITIDYVAPLATLTPTGITATSAVLTGTDLNSDANVKFDYGVDVNPIDYTNSTPNATGSSGTYTYTLTGMTPNTSYDYRIDGDSGQGNNVLFKTLQLPVTGSAAPMATSAVLQGTDPNTTPESYWFEYGKTTSYGSSTAHATSASGTLSATITALTPNTTYHFRIVSAAGAGLDASFKTPLAPVTGGANSITATTAVVTGTDPNAGEKYHFEYGKTTSYGLSTPAATAASGTLTATLHGLVAATTYHFRIVSTAGAGADATFKTLVLDEGVAVKGPKHGSVDGKLTYHVTILNTASAPITLPLVRVSFLGKHHKVVLVKRHGCNGKQSLLCRVSTIPGNKSRTLTIVIKPLHAGTLKVRATIVLLGTGSDPTPKDNVSTVTTNVSGKH